jgi:hypothetical protein
MAVTKGTDQVRLPGYRGLRNKWYQIIRIFQIICRTGSPADFGRHPKRYAGPSTDVSRTAATEPVCTTGPGFAQSILPSVGPMIAWPCNQERWHGDSLRSGGAGISSGFGEGDLKQKLFGNGVDLECFRRPISGIESLIRAAGSGSA